MFLSNTVRRIHRIVRTLPVVAAVASVALTAGPAAPAEPDPGYTTQVRTQSVPTGPAYGAAYVDCPAGSLAIASGQVVGDPDGMLLSGSTTTAGTGAFGSAYLVTGGDLQVWTTCVAAARLQGATTASVNVRSGQSMQWRYQNRTVTCPDGTVAYGGGGNVINSGVYDAAGLYTYGTVPDGRSWTYAGAGALGTRSLLVETHCLPRQRLGTIRVVEQTIISPDLTGRQHIFAAPRCPVGYFAFAGGGWYHTQSSGEPSWNGYLDANMMAADQRWWYVAGDAFNPRTRLTARVACTDRLG